MESSKVKIIEDKARKLMNSSEDKLKKTKKASLPFIYYYILEDANFHSENRILESAGAFKKRSESDEVEYEDYRKSGGRTYNL
jgi:hypothetical protein